jgi:transcriptional regulator with XRE-family HTH domain
MLDAPEQSIGERIRSERHKLNLSIEALARLTKIRDGAGVGVSAVALRRYELGTNLPHARAVRVLCETFKCSSDYLILNFQETAKDAALRAAERELIRALKAYIRALV